MNIPIQFNRSTLPGLTIALILISVAITLLSAFGDNRNLISGWYISNFPADADLPEVRNGEVWRLLTPVFLHFHPLHLIFNMLWLWILGRTIEKLQSPLRLLQLVLFMGVISNLGQFYADGPRFGGMSGVVYGLFAYVWAQGKYNPGSGLFLHKSVAIQIIVWYLICWTGLVGPIANIAHTVGLLVGLIIGYMGKQSGKLPGS